MTDQRELDRLMTAFFVEGTDELADRVIDAALDEIDHTEQRRRPPVPRRIQTMTMPIRLAAAAVIGVLAVGGVLYYLQGNQPNVGRPPATAGPVATAAWTSTGSMAVDRVSAGTALLPDGRVLVAGGTRGGEGAAGLEWSAEIYDPATGTWRKTGAMLRPRLYPTATVLDDGRVLVTGGDGGTNATAEIYDPAADTWTLASPMHDGRGQHMATRLKDGRVLVVGGPAATAEIYDPGTDTWTRTDDPTSARASSGIVTLEDGRVLVYGGYTDDRRSAELYDPATGTWTPTGPMQTARVDDQNAAVRLSDGRVLAVGGPTLQMTAELYDPATGTWTATGPLVHEIGDPELAATLLGDGTVLFVSGATETSTTPARAERYDPVTNTWTDAGAMTSGAHVRSATTLPSGKVVVIGSSTIEGDGVSAVDLFDPTVSP